MQRLLNHADWELMEGTVVSMTRPADPVEVIAGSTGRAVPGVRASGNRAAGNGDSTSSSSYHGYEGENYFSHDWGGEDGDLFWRIDWILATPGVTAHRAWVDTYADPGFAVLTERIARMLDEADPDPAVAEARFREGMAHELAFWDVP